MDSIFILFMSNHINSKSVFVVIPAYNEHAVIGKVIEELLTYNYSLIVVDDGSTESLFPFLKDYPIFFLNHRVNLGQGAALQTGIKFALTRKADYIVTFDGDGQHSAGDISKLLEPITSKKCDITIGTRFMPESKHNMPLKRKALLQITRYVNFLFTGLLLSDAYNGVRAMSELAAKTITIKERGMAHSTEILSKIKEEKLRLLEIPVTINYTSYSLKKGLTIWNGFRIFFDILLNKVFK